MRTKFSSELDALTNDLTVMSALAHKAIRRATVAAVQADLPAAYEVFAFDDQIKTAHGTCQERAMLLLALQAPVARDLRHVVTGIQIADDLFQMGALTARIAECVYRRNPDPLAPPTTLRILSTMGDLSTSLADAASRAVTSGDSQPQTDVTGHRDMVGELHRQLLSTLTGPAWTFSTGSAVDVALLSHHFERYAQHAAQIVRRIRFFDTGTTTEPADS